MVFKRSSFKNLVRCRVEFYNHHILVALFAKGRAHQGPFFAPKSSFYHTWIMLKISPIFYTLCIKNDVVRTGSFLSNISTYVNFLFWPGKDLKRRSPQPPYFSLLFLYPWKFFTSFLLLSKLHCFHKYKINILSIFFLKYLQQKWG